MKKMNWPNKKKKNQKKSLFVFSLHLLNSVYQRRNRIFIAIKGSLANYFSENFSGFQL